MGLKKTNYTVQEIGLTIPEAYAQIVATSVDKAGKAYAVFAVQQSRGDIGKFTPLETVAITHMVDKEKPLHEQMYVKAKEEIFKDWEDDIIEVSDNG